MKYIDIANRFADYPLIRVSDIKMLYPDFDHRRLYEWQKKGYIKKITKNNYYFANRKYSEEELNWIAGELIKPSYLSLEYALSYYSLIPETVYWRTYITTNRTKKIVTSLGNFQYKKIQPSMYFGFILKKTTNNLYYQLAEPEKAVLDWLYLRSDIKNSDDLEELRFNKSEFSTKIDPVKLLSYAKKINKPVLIRKIKLLLKFTKS